MVLFLLIGTILYGIVGIRAPYSQYRKAGLTDTESKEKAAENGQEMFLSSSVKDSLINSAKIKNTWALLVLYFTTFGGFIALTAWFPTYWAEYQNFAPAKPGLFTAIFSILASGIRRLYRR